MVFHQEVKRAQLAHAADFHIASSRPAGTDSCGRLGMVISRADRRSCSLRQRGFVGFQLVAQAGHFGQNRRASSPLRLASPTCLDRLLRRACRSCAWRVCRVLRSCSSWANASASRVKPRAPGGRPRRPARCEAVGYVKHEKSLISRCWRVRCARVARLADHYTALCAGRGGLRPGQVAGVTWHGAQAGWLRQQDGAGAAGQRGAVGAAQ